MNYDILRKTGAGLIVTAFALTALGFGVAALLTLLVAGIIDILLVTKKQATISNWVHKVIPKRIDNVILVGLVVFTWWMWGPETFLPVMLGVITGHLFWNSSN